MPKYISTVDSGNFAGHLLVVKQWCKEHLPVGSVPASAKEGLTDTLVQLNREISAVKSVSMTAGGVTVGQLQDSVNGAVELVKKSRATSMAEWEDFLLSLLSHLQDAEDVLNALCLDPTAAVKFTDCRTWMSLSLTQVRELQRDLPLLHSIEAQRPWMERKAVLAEQCQAMFHSMDFKFLFDAQRKLFSIGFRVDGNVCDVYHYDMLASESRLASFIAIAKGDVAQEHWFRLGRQLTSVSGSQALISWTASMFEYLMPLLVMRSYDNTLLHQTYHAVVARQVEYGKATSVPWGISEAGYNARDLQMSYQYGPFGVPGLGLKRGLSEDLVVSPYSSMLAAMVDPIAALSNLKSLETIQAFHRFGFRESIDYTAKRLPNKESRYVLKSYMAHHQGMSLLSLNNVLHGCVMQHRFHADPIVQATQLLLQERIPTNANLSLPRADEVRLEGSSYFFSSHPNPRVYTDPSLPTPRTQLLSNGKYSVMITSSGSGYSRCNGVAVNRWREDATRDHWGQYFYIRDRTSNSIWSCGYQPVCSKPAEYEVTFAEDKVELVRVDHDIVTHTEIIVATTDNVELRRISLTNHGDAERRLEVTSFQEVVLAPPADDDAHTTFSNLFVQTEFDVNRQSLLATRRLRTPGKPQVWAFHVVVVEGDSIGSIQYETDRARFIGRGRSAAAPFALHNQGQPLSNSVGSVLDPCFSIRQSVLVPAGATVRVTFSTGMTGSRDEALSFADKYQDPHLFTREAAMVWTQSQVQLRHLNIDTDKAHLYQRLAGRVLYSDSSLRPHGRLLSSNQRVQSNLWPYGISGDLPIILAGINDEKDMSMIREVLHAHEYLRLKGVSTDLVILNEHPPSYVQMLQDEIQRQISMSASSTLLDQKGGVYIRRSDIMPKEDVVLLKSIARVYLRADQGTLEEQTKRRPVEMLLSPPLVTAVKAQRRESRISILPPILPLAELSRQLSRSTSSSELVSFNGLGGFTVDGREYVISLLEDQWTPAPWINVLANANNFGCIVSESGCGYTWSVNSRENRLTPWSNDPIQDTPGEALYVRDESTGEYWSPTPLPIREAEKYSVRHGQGYSTIEHTSHGVQQRVRIFVPNADNAFDADIKLTELTLTNSTSQPRHLSVTAYHELVLGIQRHLSTPTVVTEIDPISRAVYATNPYNNEFNSRVAFADLVADGEKSSTCDRTEFLGRNGSPASPAAMSRQRLAANSGAALDPCAAFRVSFLLAGGESRRFIVQLGQADSTASAKRIMAMYHTPTAVDAAFAAVVQYWEGVVGNIEVKTPDPTFNLLVNRWLLYQTLSCRVWARSAFYQSGGAFGFRDQLQDVMALVYSEPQLTRDQLLRAAGRQFPEGDVQHWWHPPTGRGVRTHCSDDALFLPFVLSFYVTVTGDRSILDETVPFIKAPVLQPGQDDSYLLPTVDDSSSATVLEHAIRVADRHLTGGAHNLPFIGSCDWNDGMNMVGHEGKGESVWLAWFLYLTLHRFSDLCDQCGRAQQAEAYRGRMKSLKVAIEEAAWDGEWYRRAFFDDGTPLGSAMSDECQIDSIAQSWAVLSGAGDKRRARQAMESADHRLVSREAGLIKLFTPPFDKSALNPGYIKGYVPGVRENGGQYTHAAVWMVMAFAEMGEGERALELFQMLNPINHTANRAGVQRYKVEPYVMAADVYGRAPHVGRGGWTWYTGSSSWMYRCAVEAILGFDLQAGVLRLRPRLPRGWTDFQMVYRRKAAVLGKGPAVTVKGGVYRIFVTNKGRTAAAAAGDAPQQDDAVYELDGQSVASAEITLPDDGAEHVIRVQV